ncbi:hypothetical protein ACWJJH_04185 [Endozoicomonadaceae bacterium StTr2]
MKINNHIGVFALSIFVISVLLSTYTAFYYDIVWSQGLLIGVADGVLHVVTGSVGYWAGTRMTSMKPVNGKVRVDAAIAYGLAFFLSNLLGLFALSAFLFPLLTGVWAFLIGWRLNRKPRDKKAVPTIEKAV